MTWPIEAWLWARMKHCLLHSISCSKSCHIFICSMLALWLSLTSFCFSRNFCRPQKKEVISHVLKVQTAGGIQHGGKQIRSVGKYSHCKQPKFCIWDKYNRKIQSNTWEGKSKRANTQDGNKKYPHKKGRDARGLEYVLIGAEDSWRKQGDEKNVFSSMQDIKQDIHKFADRQTKAGHKLNNTGDSVASEYRKQCKPLGTRQKLSATD